MVYGRQVESLDDEYIKLANEEFDVIMQAKKPGAFFVDFMPFIRHIPSCIPGAASRKFAEKHRPTVERLRDEAFYDAKRLFVSHFFSRPLVVLTAIDRMVVHKGRQLYMQCWRIFRQSSLRLRRIHSMRK